MKQSTAAFGVDMLSPGRTVIAMKALMPLAVAAVAGLSLLAASSMAVAQGSARGGGGGGSFQGGAPPGGGSLQGGAPRGGGSFQGAPQGRGGWYGGAYSARGGGYPRHYHGTHGYARGGSTFFFGFYGPGYWWGPGYWPGYWWGPGYWGPRYVYPAYPYYGYYPPAYESPPVYVERDPPAQPAEPTWWYWCTEAKAYYPYVKECSGGWQRVPPQPVPPASQ